MRRHWVLLGGCLLLPVLAAASAADPASAVKRLELTDGDITFQATNAFGGRVLAWHLVGEPNVLKIGAAVDTQPTPLVSAASGDIPYLGHDVWVGPQSQWWLHQELNAERRQAAANWPPDPFLSLAATRVVARDAHRITLEGRQSPVSGVRLRKHFSLAADEPATVLLTAEARNVRAAPVSWDLWFNTRVAASTRVFVPVAAAEDFDLKAVLEQGIDAPQHRWTGGLFELTGQWSDSDSVQRGKYRLQPSAGWMAGFSGRQVFVIRFEHQPKARIHREQGQVELYLEARSRAPGDGLLEMEVHGPYETLQPQARMQATERWTLLHYDGPDTPQAQRAFLCEHAPRLALAHACGS
ncbi:MAG TPA: DUF4380 domain-containing protein [Stenotrophomonas sp.]